MQSYGELCTQFYDLDKPQAPELALAWYRRHLQAAKGPVLEPMCGSGRFLVPLAEAGIVLDGADPSEPMLKACRRKLDARGLYAGLSQQTLEALDLGKVYAAAFIPSSSFCLLGKAAAQQGLHRLRAHLGHGAAVYIEFEIPHGADHIPGANPRTVTEGKRQIRLISRTEYDARTRVETFYNQYELKISGRVVQLEEEVLHLQSYTPDEMRLMLASAGFTEIEVEHPEFGWVVTARVG
ncbi:MAG: class I SAM-dependent methyltransferase [Planctomycetes bacterium]|nr:class I SAM-dependent methyltransferase [Planctomycetota bacterium]